MYHININKIVKMNKRKEKKKLLRNPEILISFNYQATINNNVFMIFGNFFFSFNSNKISQEITKV